MKRMGFVLLFLLTFFVTDSVFAQGPVPEIKFQSVPDFLKLPKDMYLGEVAGVTPSTASGHLMRMLDADGYFYMTVFDRWSKDVEQRDICSYTTQQGHKFDTYQSGYRQGAGSAIAALARVQRLTYAARRGVLRTAKLASRENLRVTRSF